MLSYIISGICFAVVYVGWLQYRTQHRHETLLGSFAGFVTFWVRKAKNTVNK